MRSCWLLVFFLGEHEDRQKLGDAMVVPGKQMMRTSKYILVSGTKNLSTHMYIDTQVHDTQVYRSDSVAPNPEFAMSD